jgi:hypothetical protein
MKVCWLLLLYVSFYFDSTFGWTFKTTSTQPIQALCKPAARETQWAHQPDETLQRLSSRRLFFAATAASILSQTIPSALAAPPIAIISEELGYFPVQNKQGDMVYIPKRVSRESSKQAVDLAKLLTEKGVFMAGTYWCPHTSRQKELFGREAWSLIRYVECSPKGYGAEAKLCATQNIEGYPTWIFPDGKQLSGERSLGVIAKEVGFKGFREELETNVPPLMGAQACMSS